MDLSKSKIDLHSSEDGVWVEIDPDTSLLLARYRNPKHQAFLTKAMTPYIRLHRMGTMDEEVAEQIEIEGIAKHVLLGWKGIKDNGLDIPYSYDNAVKLLSDPQLSWFSELVRDLSSDISRFREQHIEDSSDNIKKLSSGS